MVRGYRLFICVSAFRVCACVSVCVRPCALKHLYQGDESLTVLLSVDPLQRKWVYLADYHFYRKFQVKGFLIGRNICVFFTSSMSNVLNIIAKQLNLGKPSLIEFD